ncbi:MAG TPA: glucose-1-phosphate adenylyltransferase [Myxococcota bacterium]|nr:glucose-1-phosphate adenylyltransferase [Myxococcota bacterium]
MVPVRDSLALVLAGGEGRRLTPLTSERSKPAMYFGGRYRLVDFVLSNLVNSGYTQIRVLTQYRATSLIRHLSRAWSLGGGVLDASIDPVPAGQNIGPFWFRGTADAIFQNLDLLREMRPRDVAIFGSDHVYKMDISAMLESHRERGADLTVATLPVPRSAAREFGCVKVDADGRVVDFMEKPADPPAMPGHPDLTLVSMGNYVFRTSLLLAELRRDADTEETTHDFGRDVLTTAHKRMKVVAYDFASQVCPGESESSRGYWRDVGTIDAFFEANMDLVSVEPRLNLYNDLWPIRGTQPPSGPCKFVFGDEGDGRVGHAIDSIVGSGSIISGGTLERTVCFYRVRVNSYSHVSESVLFPTVDVGRGVKLRRCIVDKGVRIPAGEEIGFDLERDRKRFTVSDGGIVVVSRADFGQRDEFDV